MPWPRRRPILAHGPAAVEVIDSYVLDSTRLNPEARRLRDFLHGDPGAILIVEFYGDAPRSCRRGSTPWKPTCAGAASATTTTVRPDAAAQARIWKLRKLALGLSMAEKGDAKAISFVEDTAVAPEHLRDYIAEFLELDRPPRHHGRRLRPCVGRLPARPAGRSI